MPGTEPLSFSYHWGFPILLVDKEIPLLTPLKLLAKVARGLHFAKFKAQPPPASYLTFLQRWPPSFFSLLANTFFSWLPGCHSCLVFLLCPWPLLPRRLLPPPFSVDTCRLGPQNPCSSRLDSLLNLTHSLGSLIWAPGFLHWQLPPGRLRSSSVPEFQPHTASHLFRVSTSSHVWIRGSFLQVHVSQSLLRIS